MSLKALREGAEVLRAQASYPESPLYAMYLKMMAEIEDVERAALEVRVWGIGPIVMPPGESGQHRSEYHADWERRRFAAYEVLTRVAAKDAE